MPYYLGKKRALRIYPWLPASAYVLIVLAVGLRFLPWLVLLVLLMWPRVRKNIQRFEAVQDKEKTFNTAVANMLLTSGTETILLIMAIGLNLAWPGVF